MATPNDVGKRGLGRVAQTLGVGTERRGLMTMRVSRDSGRSWERETVVREGDPVALLYDPGRYPPCECAQCAGWRTHSARSLRPAVVRPGAA